MYNPYPLAQRYKKYMSVIYDFHNKVFVPGKPFQKSLMFVSKAGAYPSEAPFRFSTLG